MGIFLVSRKIDRFAAKILHIFCFYPIQRYSEMVIDTNFAYPGDSPFCAGVSPFHISRQTREAHLPYPATARAGGGVHLASAKAAARFLFSALLLGAALCYRS
jgi:hypothetical protein